MFTFSFRSTSQSRIRSPVVENVSFNSLKATDANSQAMVSMMLPSVLVELLEELEFELPRSAIELSMNDEMID